MLILYQIALAISQGVTMGFLQVWAKLGPQLVEATIAAARRGWQSTVTEAPAAPADLIQAADQELKDAMQAIDAKRTGLG